MFRHKLKVTASRLLCLAFHAPKPFAIYIAANFIVMTALTFIMGIFMKRCNNLLIAFWIHYCFNLSLLFSAGEVYFFAILSALYALVTLILLRFFHPKTQSVRG